MDLDEEDPAARGLRRYARLVAEAVGVGSTPSVVQLNEPVGVCLPLVRCAADQRDGDLALLWDERCGWALAIDSGGGVDVRIVGFLCTELVPAPRVVAEYVDRARYGDGFGELAPPARESDDLLG
jgi:hypothetical protein